MSYNRWPHEIVLFSVMVNIIMCGLPIAQIVMGFVYKDDCPIDDQIPLFLLVNGIGFTLWFQQLWFSTKGKSLLANQSLLLFY